MLTAIFENLEWIALTIALGVICALLVLAVIEVLPILMDVREAEKDAGKDELQW